MSGTLTETVTVYFDLSVHDHEVDPDRILIRLIESGPVDYGFRIKDSQVRKVALTNQSSIFQTQVRSRKAGHLVDRKFQRHQFLIPHVVSQDARVRAPTSRV